MFSVALLLVIKIWNDNLKWHIKQTKKGVLLLLISSQNRTFIIQKKYICEAKLANHQVI